MASLLAFQQASGYIRNAVSLARMAPARDILVLPTTSNAQPQNATSCPT